MKKKLPPLLRLVVQTFTLRRLVFNRFVFIVLVLSGLAVGANAYIADNQGEQVTGQVVTADGDPVSNTTLVLKKIRPLHSTEQETTRTDQDGRFVFENQTNLEYIIEVETEQGSATERRHVYFRGQSIHVTLIVGES